MCAASFESKSNYPWIRRLFDANVARNSEPPHGTFSVRIRCSCVCWTGRLPSNSNYNIYMNQIVHIMKREQAPDRSRIGKFPSKHIVFWSSLALVRVRRVYVDYRLPHVKHVFSFLCRCRSKIPTAADHNTERRMGNTHVFCTKFMNIWCSGWKRRSVACGMRSAGSNTHDISMCGWEPYAGNFCI